MSDFTVVEVCAGAGGQSLGLHRAGFCHKVAIELDALAAETLRDNLGIEVLVGDVANSLVWNPAEYAGATLFAGGVPCPPFSVAGKQLGSSDERDLFAWAIEQVAVIRPRVVMLENVRGLSGPKFSAYRQRVLDRLTEFGYVGEWKLLTSADFGVPQLRPRFVLIAMSEADMRHFYWPSSTVLQHRSVGEVLHELMAANGWKFADEWRELADGVGPTIVGGSKKHGGADLGPTRAKQGWAKLFVDGKGVTESAPVQSAPSAREVMPRLTIEMVARVQGWTAADNWRFAGRKTAQYRQIGNAFPPPVAEAIGNSIARALRKETPPREVGVDEVLQDPLYRALVGASSGLTLDDLAQAVSSEDHVGVEQQVSLLEQDFYIERVNIGTEPTRLVLGAFKGFTGQEDHLRNRYLRDHASKVS